MCRSRLVLTSSGNSKLVEVNPVTGVIAAFPEATVLACPIFSKSELSCPCFRRGYQVRKGTTSPEEKILQAAMVKTSSE